MSDLKKRLEALRPAMAKVAQEVLDAWEQDDEGVDEEFGAGGACDAIDNAIAGVVFEKVVGVERTAYGHEGDDHAASIYYDDAEAYLVDIPPYVYETGGGYRWRKRKGVKLSAKDVVVEKVSRADLDDYGYSKGSRGAWGSGWPRRGRCPTPTPPGRPRSRTTTSARSSSRAGRPRARAR